jgi:predicted RNase H-like nuclease (RuvC/YqgF family)
MKEEMFKILKTILKIILGGIIVVWFTVGTFSILENNDLRVEKEKWLKQEEKYKKTVQECGQKSTELEEKVMSLENTLTEKENTINELNQEVENLKKK